MSRALKLYLEDILNSIRKIQNYTNQMTKAELSKDERTFDAVVYNLQIIGEATKNIPQNIRDQHSQMEWKKIIALRNIITHAYFYIDDEIVWDIIQTKLAPLKACIELILNTENLEDNNEL